MWRAGKLAAVILATRDATCLSAVNHGVGVPMSCEGGVEWITSPTIQESGRTFPAPGVSGNNPRKLPPLPCSGSCRPFLNSIMWTRLTTRIEKDSPQEHTGRKVFYKTLVDVLMCVANTHEGKSSEKHWSMSSCLRPTYMKESLLKKTPLVYVLLCVNGGLTLHL